MQKLLFLFSFFLFTSFSASDYALLKSITVKSTALTTDNLGNAYLISENQLLQYDSSGNFLRSYSEFNAGNLQSIDASNPLKILLFYRDFTQINILDSKLALQTKIQLRDIGILQPLQICSSSNNDAIWIFDQQDFQLKRLNTQLQVTYESGNINQMLGYDINPQFLTEDNNLIFLNNPKTGIIVFDNLGSYLKTIPIPNINSFQIIGDEFIYLKNGEVKSYNLKTLAEKTMLVPNLDTTVVSMRIGKQKLYLQRKDKLDLYSF